MERKQNTSAVADDQSAADSKVLFPGRVLEIEIGHNEVLAVTVFPVGLRHFTKFTGAIGQVFTAVTAALEKIEVDPNDPENVKISGSDWRVVLDAVMPHITGDLYGVLAECVSGINMKSEHVPHWVEIQIIEAWLDESFGRAEKVRPWIGAIEKLIERVTGNRPDLWQTVCKFFSRAGTASTASSDISNPVAPTTE